MNQTDEKSSKISEFQTENHAFEHSEMLTCAACERANAPTRRRCLYCAAELPLSEKYRDAQKFEKLNLRKLEDWEKGWNLIFNGQVSAEINYAVVSELLNLDSNILEKIIGSSKNLPLLRAETECEAEIVREQLKLAKIETKLVSDESLMPEIFPRRLRGLEFDENKIKLTLFNSGEVAEIAAADLMLIVSGAIFERRAETIEKRKKKETQIIESSETASDEIMFDIYSRDDRIGYRILTKGFDFSCLGAAKGIIARDNLKKLAAQLREIAPNAKLVDDYLQIREILGGVWEIENRRDAKGFKRHNFSKFDFASVESSSNLLQFTKYSRLQKVYEKD